MHLFTVCSHVCTVETLGLSMELNDNILVQTTSPQTIARVKRVKCFMLQKVAQKMRQNLSHLLRLFAWYVRFHSLNASNSLRGNQFVLISDCREQILQNL
jgi:hypothetical protein